LFVKYDVVTNSVRVDQINTWLRMRPHNVDMINLPLVGQPLVIY